MSEDEKDKSRKEFLQRLKEDRVRLIKGETKPRKPLISILLILALQYIIKLGLDNDFLADIQDGWLNTRLKECIDDLKNENEFIF